ncbi:MAG: 2OG-Fe(II) oxygenase [Alphaproteobacteria bacterium]|nr:2OG-Fe(II) oxygenase [Alphaproteobacteria bacterium]
MIRVDHGRTAIARRVACVDWLTVAAELDERGFARVPDLLTPAACKALAALYGDEARFRSRVIMARHGFGRGEYQYFADPLPPPVAELRGAIYPLLAPVANRWSEHLRGAPRFPPTLDRYSAQCHRAGQAKPTPLLLKYGSGDYNCLHQDLYGELVFPLQLTILLSDPARDFTGGEFLLVEQRPRRQSRGEAIRLGQGEAVIFAVRERPVAGSRGYYRATMRHGVSTVRSGSRFTLGIIFHDAK